MFLRKVYYTKKSLDHLEYDRNDIRKFQTRLLKQLIPYVYENFPFYREKWDDHGFSPDDFETVEDIRKIPVIDSDDFRGKVEDMHERLGEPAGSLKSSGSSGRPRLEVGFDEKAHDWLESVYMRGFLENGYSIFGKKSYYWYEKFRERFQNSLFVRKELIHKDLSLEEQLELLEKQDNDFIVYFPQVLFALAKYALNSDRSFDIDPEIVFTQGEILTPGMREVIEDVFDCQVYNHYGSTEFNRIAWECEKGGYHINEDSVLVEIMDEDYNRVDEGEVGRVVGTSLVNMYTPIIRYDQGDLVEKSENNCDINFRKIERIMGRRKNCIPVKDGVIYPSEIVEKLSGFLKLVEHRLVRRRDGSFVLKYVSEEELSERYRDRIKEALRDLGIGEVCFERKERLERTNGGKIPPVKMDQT